MTDRRRLNGPTSGTTPPLYQSSLLGSRAQQRPVRTRQPDEPRKIFLQTGLTPSASGSAYFELTSERNGKTSLIPTASALKLTCTVHGPRPLPRSAPFSPQLVLSTYVKYAPFAARQRRGFVRDPSERDLGKHLETALRSIVIGERWPKSGVEVIITILESEEDMWWAESSVETSGAINVGGWGTMTVLAGCITAASAALAEAGIDCVDLVAGGVAAFVKSPSSVQPHARKGKAAAHQDEEILVLDPCPAEHEEIVAMCVVGYLGSRDEIAEIWLKGETGIKADELIDKATLAATASGTVLRAALKEAVERQFDTEDAKVAMDSTANKTDDAEMTG